MHQERVVARKFGSGGPFNQNTGGPYKKTETVRASAVQIDENFVACVSTMAQYIFDTFGRFSATVPAIHVLMFLQAHRLDTEFYDRHFEPGTYLRTHAAHERDWS